MNRRLHPQAVQHLHCFHQLAFRNRAIRNYRQPCQFSPLKQHRRCQCPLRICQFFMRVFNSPRTIVAADTQLSCRIINIQLQLTAHRTYDTSHFLFHSHSLISKLRLVNPFSSLALSRTVSISAGSTTRLRIRLNSSPFLTMINSQFFIGRRTRKVNSTS